MKWLRAALSLLLAAAVFRGLDKSNGLVPPLGKLMNPFAGFWLNGNRGDEPPEKLDVPGLGGEVRVIYDTRRVPHVFAGDDHDLYFAQGYITARDRLWQMEFQTHAAAGRLSEIVGEAALPLDREQRRMGMVWAAENALRSFLGSAKTREVLQAYSDGVNAYIGTLGRRTYPLEYKILDYAPEPWTPLKCALLLKSMSRDLTAGGSEGALTALLRTRDREFVDRVYPFAPPFANPIIPPETEWGFTPLPVSAPPPASPGGEAAISLIDGSGAVETPDIDKGSNNWVVAGRLTAGGRPILCNDPHLALSLPSLWYEIQLSAPGVNVNGVSLPGAPMVVIGYNERIAWGVTNAGSDVFDWYAVRFKDESRAEYEFGGSWLKTSRRAEEIRVRGRRRPVADEVVYTHHGPVVRLDGEPPSPGIDAPPGAALRWTAHDTSDELTALYLLNRAGDYETFVAALGHWSCPAQNFAYADIDGHIALRHDGRFPLRGQGQGRYVMDGSDPAQEWQGWIPHDHVPAVRNPEQGFVGSANQTPANSSYPYYLGWDYASFERGARIDELLAGMSGITPQDMLRMQTDDLSLRARLVLPRLLDCLRDKDLAAAERPLFEALAAWEFRNEPGSAAPTIFDRFWTEFNAQVWNDEGREDGPIPWPNSELTIDLVLREPGADVFDDRRTLERESLDVMAARAFRAARDNLERRLGPFGETWTWGRARGTDIRHLARIPGLGRAGLPTGGGSGVVNATGRTGGPSWRMTVELGPGVRAWGIVPGGASGHPGSRFYDDAVDDWVAGKAYELVFLKSPEDNHPEIAFRTLLRGAR